MEHGQSPSQQSPSQQHLKEPNTAYRYYENTVLIAAVGNIKGGGISENQFPFHHLFSNCSAPQCSIGSHSPVAQMSSGSGGASRHSSNSNVLMDVLNGIIFSFLRKWIKTKVKPSICKGECAETAKGEKMPFQEFASASHLHPQGKVLFLVAWLHAAPHGWLQFS